jgi:hypothetical protein
LRGKNENYLVFHEDESDSRRCVIDNKDKILFKQLIKITPITDNIFDWLLILEKASAYKMIDSCFVNLASQMNFHVKGTRYWKPMYRSELDYPILNKHWTTVR